MYLYNIKLYNLRIVKMAVKYSNILEFIVNYSHIFLIITCVLLCGISINNIHW